MKIFIAGICGTFMAGIAQLGKASGFNILGCDSNVYPPMSTLLENEGIEIFEGYQHELLTRAGFEKDKDKIVIGNALSRGNPLIEFILDENLSYQSGPQWLHDNILMDRKVIAVAGTHGKTTTSSMINWIMHECAVKPGYLIGGKPGNFKNSAEIGESDWFVIEADEYDTAFFDKRSKFVHYNPHVVLLNNLEFDHADIFRDQEQINTQFHHLVRIVPQSGTIIANNDDTNIGDVLKIGCWSNVQGFSIKDKSSDWFATTLTQDNARFEVFNNGKFLGRVEWSCIGQHNMQNALAAIATTSLTGIDTEQACQALTSFKPTDRRLQLLYQDQDVILYEDFAHHPTAIKLTIDAIKSKYPDYKIVVVLEPRSNTMKSGVHGNLLGKSLDQADVAFLYHTQNLEWTPKHLVTTADLHVSSSKSELVENVGLSIGENSVIICMSNGSFDGIPGALKEHLELCAVKA